MLTCVRSHRVRVFAGHRGLNCNIPQHTAAHCNTHLPRTISISTHVVSDSAGICGAQRTWLQHAATRCNTLQHAATHCNTHLPQTISRLTHVVSHSAGICGAGLVLCALGAAVNLEILWGRCLSAESFVFLDYHVPRPLIKSLTLQTIDWIRWRWVISVNLMEFIAIQEHIKFCQI